MVCIALQHGSLRGRSSPSNDPWGNVRHTTPQRGFRPQDPQCVPPQACYVVRGMIVVDMPSYMVEYGCERLPLFNDRAPQAYRSGSEGMIRARTQNRDRCIATKVAAQHPRDIACRAWNSRRSLFRQAQPSTPRFALHHYVEKLWVKASLTSCSDTIRKKSSNADPPAPSLGGAQCDVPYQ